MNTESTKQTFVINVMITLNLNLSWIKAYFPKCKNYKGQKADKIQELFPKLALQYSHIIL